MEASVVDQKVHCNSSVFQTPQQTGKFGGKHVAINIRKELKAWFKNVKFSVTSNFDSVYVECPNEFTKEQKKSIEKFLGKWLSGDFDGMSDCYIYNRSNFNKIYGSCKYIWVS